MSYTNEIFQRSSIQGITEYLLYGDTPEEGKEDYEKRISDAYQQCEDILMRYETDRESELYSAVYKLMGEYEKVYMELGFQAGLLMMQDALDKFRPAKPLAERKQSDE